MPVRQWVLSFPYEIRYHLAYDGEWVSKVLAVFLRVVGRWYRHQAQAVGHGSTRWGSVTLVQRSGSSLNLNPHVHVLMLDGVYVDGKKAPVFVPAPPLSDPDVQQIVQTSARRIIRLCTQHGLLDDTQADWLADEEPVLAALTAADCDSSAPPCGYRLGWAALLARVFAADISGCPACGGRLRIVAALTDPASTRTYLEGVGLPAVPPPRAPPQPQFEFAA